MDNVQSGILAPCPKLARYLSFSLQAGSRPARAVKALSEFADGESIVVGLGHPLVRVLGRDIAGLRVFPTQFGSGLVLPSCSAALWCWLRGDDRGKLLHAGRKIIAAVSSAFSLDSVVDGFQYDSGRDLTGFVDGTENPKGRKASAAAIVRGEGAGLDGSSFVAVQQWIHDFRRFEAMAEGPGQRHRPASQRQQRADWRAALGPYQAHGSGKFLAGGVHFAALDALDRREGRRFEFRRFREILRCL